MPGSDSTPDVRADFPVVRTEAGGTLAVTTGAVADLKPGQFPTHPGSTTVEHVTLPAPWTGGTTTSVDVYVRLPRGYDPTRTRYPTVDVTPNLFCVLAGLSSQAFFGPEMDRFSGILDQNGYARAVIEAPYGHSSLTVQEFLPRALRLVAARMVKEGVIP